MSKVCEYKDCQNEVGTDYSKEDLEEINLTSDSNESILACPECYSAIYIEKIEEMHDHSPSDLISDDLVDNFDVDSYIEAVNE